MKLGIQHAYCNSSDKIWVFWEDEWKGEVVRDNGQHLTIKFSRNSMEELELVAKDNTLPWLVGGDFNVILNDEEKQGGLDFTQSKALDFSQCVNNCALTELKYTGSKFTWWNGRIEGKCIFKRLDIILRNQEFFNRMPTSEVQHLVRQGSHYAPFYLICRSDEEPAVQPFKFLNLWTKHPDFKKIIEENWKIDFVGTPFTEFQAKIKKDKKGSSVLEQGNIWKYIPTGGNVRRRSTS
ncbi:hypothetical protein KY290_007675 [Solanum tuberosum]|uniref:Non-LTR retroelement reverse transcriptase n=1 Tax=Solanum tuberosum TaxID=4113 RepID=A0ABQ7W877_SOLTU|nr:hypothetical protein KY290_007675 [Solanum tuberosum]